MKVKQKFYNQQEKSIVLTDLKDINNQLLPGILNNQIKSAMNKGVEKKRPDYQL